MTLLTPNWLTCDPFPWQLRVASGSFMSRKDGAGGVSVAPRKAPSALLPVSETAIESAVPSFKPAPSNTEPSASMARSNPPHAWTTPWVSSW